MTVPLCRSLGALVWMVPALLVGRGVTKIVPGHRICHSRIVRKASGSLRKASGSLDPWHVALSSVTADRRDFKGTAVQNIPRIAGALTVGQPGAAALLFRTALGLVGREPIRTT